MSTPEQVLRDAIRVYGDTPEVREAYRKIFTVWKGCKFNCFEGALMGSRSNPVKCACLFLNWF